MDNDELMHYGVPGMKWGVRRTPAQLGRKKTSSSRFLFGKKKSKSKAKTKSESSKEETAPKKKSVKEMSDEELSTAISRLQLEQKYKELSPQKVSTGKAITKRIIALSEIIISLSLLCCIYAAFPKFFLHYIMYNQPLKIPM